MDRQPSASTAPCFGIPHARGDGPSSGGLSDRRIGYSPRTWGWTAERHHRPHRTLVFPTHVGMDRLHHDISNLLAGIPHARGDGPMTPSSSRGRFAYSPRTWGWTVQSPDEQTGGNVFPTHVGMDRGRGSCASIAGGIPHARGDGPQPASRSARSIASIPHARGDGPKAWQAKAVVAAYSPRTWGWTGDTLHFHSDEEVFPTHVGMDRQSGVAHK